MSEDFIPTRGSRTKDPNQINFQSVAHESHKPKKRNQIDPEKVNLKRGTKVEEFNIKKAKHEIVKFGVSGFDPEKKEEAKIKLAIKLGAKPPKNKYVNYKVLKEERAKQQKEEKLKSQFQQLGKNALGKSTAKKGFDRKRRKNKSDILDIYGKINKKVVNKD